MRPQWILLSALLLLPAPVTAETLTITVPPIYTPDQGQDVFKPLVDYLNAVTDHTIELEVPRDYQQHWLKIRRGEIADLVMEDAPLTAVLLADHQYQPLVRLAEDVSFSILAPGHLADSQPSDLIGMTLATVPGPSFGYLLTLNLFDNPFAQPNIQSSASSWLDAIERVFALEADVAMSPSWLVERYPNLYPIYTSDSYPGLTISVSPSVTAETAQAIQEALLNLHDNAEHFGALFELNSERFVAGNAEEYADLDRMLGNVFGGRRR